MAETAGAFAWMISSTKEAHTNPWVVPPAYVPPAAMRLYHAGHLSLPQLWRAMALNPAKRLGLPQGRLALGAPADLVLFDPDAPFVLDRFTLLSKSKNTPFDGARREGRVIGTWVGGRRVFDANETGGRDE